MSAYPSWKNVYAVGPYPTWFDTITASTDYGIGGSVSYYTDGVQALWKNNPNFAIAPDTIERETATGKPYRDSQDYLAGVKSTSLTLEFDHAIEESKYYLASLFLKIITTCQNDAENKYIIYVPYSATPDVLNAYGKQLFLTEKHGDTDTDGSTFYNGVIQSMNFSAASNETLSVSAEILGKEVITGSTQATSALSASQFGELSAASQSPLLWQNATVLVGRPEALDVDDSGWTTPAFTIGIVDDQGGGATEKMVVESDASGIAVGDYFTINTFVIDSGTGTDEKTFAVEVGSTDYSVVIDQGTYNEVTICLEIEKQFALNSQTAGYDIRVLYEPENHKFALVSDSDINIPLSLTNYQLCAHMGFSAAQSSSSYTAESGDTNYYLLASVSARAGGRNGIYKVTALPGSNVVTFSPALKTTLPTISNGNEPFRSLTMFSRVKAGNFTLNLSNNATIQFFDEQTIEAIALGRLTGEGSFTQLFGSRDAWDALTDVAESVVRPIIVFWGDGSPGSTSTDNLHMYLTGKMIGREPEDENVMMDNVSFSLVNYNFDAEAGAGGVNYRLPPVYFIVNSGSVLWEYDSGPGDEDFWNPSVKQRVAF